LFFVVVIIIIKNNMVRNKRKVLGVVPDNSDAADDVGITKNIVIVTGFEFRLRNDLNYIGRGIAKPFSQKIIIIIIRKRE